TSQQPSKTSANSQSSDQHRREDWNKKLSAVIPAAVAHRLFQQHLRGAAILLIFAAFALAKSRHSRPGF
ncbi:MAG: hypothetical protein AAF678_10245, partial [Pseudomonadota bacterium]